MLCNRFTQEVLHTMHKLLDIKGIDGAHPLQPAVPQPASDPSPRTYPPTLRVVENERDHPVTASAKASSITHAAPQQNHMTHLTGTSAQASWGVSCYRCALSNSLSQAVLESGPSFVRIMSWLQPKTWCLRMTLFPIPAITWDLQSGVTGKLLAARGKLGKSERLQSPFNPSHPEGSIMHSTASGGGPDPDGCAAARQSGG